MIFSKCSARCLLFVQLLLIFPFIYSVRAEAQKTGDLQGQILDPTGALVPGATVGLTLGDNVLTAESGADGIYHLQAVPAGSYSLTVNAEGFAPFSKPNVVIVAGQVKQLNLSLTIAVQQQDVKVTDQNNGVSLNPDENSNAIVIKGSDLDSLSDDPDQLQNELQALAGPAAGPSDGQIYIEMALAVVNFLPNLQFGRFESIRIHFLRSLTRSVMGESRSSRNLAPTNSLAISALLEVTLL
jgi:Carboxypeptidase regulatory-like domain